VIVEIEVDHKIEDPALQGQVRAELMRLYPAIRSLEFGARLTIVSIGPVDSREVYEIVGRLRYIHKHVVKDVVFEARHEPPCREDPYLHLERTGQVVPVVEGQYLIQGQFLGLMRALDAWVVELAREMGAVEQEYPSFVPVELLRRINYFKEFPHHIMIVAPLRATADALGDFAARHDANKRKFDTLDVVGALAPVALVAAPSVCYTCYYVLRSRQLDGNRLVTAKNRCSRNEPKGFSPLSRLNNFTMREVIALGDRDFVLSQRQRFLDMITGMMQRLGLAGRIESANDPFFTNDASYKAVFQHSLKLKHEWLAALPFRGDYSAVCSVNLHNDSFGKAFNVTGVDGEPMHSACIGFGLERWAFAILAQFGCDRAMWPSPLRELIDGSWGG
jgi:seryl-tRNA synthetase